ncbi:hypothetical protein B0T26DRAFT_636285 [Lasiosphaeria miniovina]|uniref:Zn(2)-C6 fungal-type domain-containing protein n=1 Tax=Lasiosphaeria miniovina TaxID=1954250 RepID=A0AA40B5G6_9PEZI|nr:uncharacterized protein B0T26DRAFT_636285 [Lasiosphaeria miniovina]KAK0728051.1 hypothetical protein B0T26DRAFT_636285 [Lasiosphaeria miniovina]
MPAAPNADPTQQGSPLPPKSVTFELMFPEYRARLPLRVSIYLHDATDSIVTTVRNFYGLYESQGVSFEDEQGNTLIARYENFRNHMIIYVRVLENVMSPAPGAFGARGFNSPPVGAQGAANGEAFSPQHYGQHIARPGSGTSRLRSLSPNGGRGRRSASAGKNSAASKKGRSRSSKNRGHGSQAAGDSHGDSVNGYSSGDGAPGSSSGKTKEQLGNTEISVENIVEGGRRKRAKFESSELPLFAPPQMPAATSNPSVSPARRIEHHRQSLPFVQPGQNPFSNPRPLQSPQSYNSGYAQPGTYATPIGDGRRTRGSFEYTQGSAGVGPGQNTMPTPDPTVQSCMSEEDKDVAIQLMRLGEMSNVSHGRTSASTLDDTFSGRADAASSTGATSEAESGSEEEMPPAQRQKLDIMGNHKVFDTIESHFAGPRESVESSGDDADYEDGPKEGSMAAPKIKSEKPKPSSVNGAKPRPQPLNKVKTSKPASKPKVKKIASTMGPMSPASLPASRKQSIASNGTFSLLPGDDDNPDLSTKPRCQRCRKSKKGCDRQRPCARCRDAGIPADQCISEDEGNGRKGRYGRHMGVPIKIGDIPAPGSLLPAAPIAATATTAGAATTAAIPPTVSAASLPPLAPGALDKNKKRKR